MPVPLAPKQLMKWSKVSCDGDAPGTRSSHTLTALQDCLYILGGERTPRLPLPLDVYCCDTKARTCKQLRVSGDQPGPRLGHSTTAIKRTLYVFGGRTGADLVDCAVGEFHAFDTEKLDWSAVGSVGTPAPRSCHAAASDDTNLYIFGGCGAQGRLNDLHRFDSTTGSWEALPSKTSVQPRGGASLLVYKCALFLIGGFNGTELGDVHMYHLKNKQGWQEVTGGYNLPARSVFACGILSQRASDDWIVVFGGEVDPSDLGHEGAGAYVDEVFGLDPNHPELGWRLLTVKGTAPSPRAWLASASCSYGLALHGGNATDNARLGDMYILGC